MPRAAASAGLDPHRPVVVAVDEPAVVGDVVDPRALLVEVAVEGIAGVGRDHLQRVFARPARIRGLPSWGCSGERAGLSSSSGVYLLRLPDTNSIFPLGVASWLALSVPLFGFIASGVSQSLPFVEPAEGGGGLVRIRHRDHVVALLRRTPPRRRAWAGR